MTAQDEEERQQIARELLTRVVAVAEKLRPILIAQGSAREVLGATLLIMIYESKASGESLPEFVQKVSLFASLFWDDA